MIFLRFYSMINSWFIFAFKTAIKIPLDNETTGRLRGISSRKKDTLESGTEQKVVIISRGLEKQNKVSK